MKEFALFLLLVISVSGFAQKRAENNALSQKRFTPKSMGYKLVWDDQFNGNSLDIPRNGMFAVWGLVGLDTTRHRQ